MKIGGTPILVLLGRTVGAMELLGGEILGAVHGD
jgi:hypothetical protein